MARLSLAEKKEAIEKFIAKHQKEFYYYKRVQEKFDACSGATLSEWVKEIYGKKPSEFFSERGVILLENDRDKWCADLIKRLKSAYQNKKPAKDVVELIKDNPDIYIEDLLDYVSYSSSDKYTWDLLDYGILRNPIETDQEFKAWIESSVERIMTSAVSFLRDHPALFIQKIIEEMKIYPFGLVFVERAFERFPSVFDCTAEEYFQEKGLLLSPKDAKKAVEKHLAILAKIYIDPDKRPDSPTGVSFYDDIKGSGVRTVRTKTGVFTFTPTEGATKTLVPHEYSIDDLSNYFRYEAEKTGMSRDETDAYVKQVFIDAGIVKGKMSPEAEKKAAESIPKKTPKKSKSENPKKSIEYANIYDEFDDINVEALCQAVDYNDHGSQGYPGDKKRKVEYAGKTFFVQFGLKRTIQRLDDLHLGCYDARKEYEIMYSEQDVKERMMKEHSYTYEWELDQVNAEFQRKFSLSEAVVARRILFLKAIGIHLADPKILEALVEYIPKKKNGTFNRTGLVRIASSMVAFSRNNVYELVGKCKSDDTVYLSFECASVNPSNLDKSKKDFVSAYWDLFDKSID